IIHFFFCFFFKIVHFAQYLKRACLVCILTMTLLKLLKCTVAKPPICCSCFSNEQLNKNVKCGKEYFTLNVSNIVLVIFKSFITFCWEKKEDKKKSHIKSQSQYFGKKSQLDYFPKSFSPSAFPLLLPFSPTSEVRTLNQVKNH